MRRTRANKRLVENSDSDSEDNIPLKKLQPYSKDESFSSNKENENTSSSESDIENYLQPANKIDLNSSFFDTRSKNEHIIDKIEKKIFDGITKLGDCEDDSDTIRVDNSAQKFKETEIESKPSTSSTKFNFYQLEEYTREVAEAKIHVDEYNARKMTSKNIEENDLDISNLLALGESKQTTVKNLIPEDLQSSDFDSCDSEQEDWEEVKNKDSQEPKETVPHRDIQIVVDMPDSCRKKKGVDLLAAMKRRLNRIRKENQVYVHKVHLLCWIAHGNYVNDIINNAELLGLALSLSPSEKCYPADRTDLSYLEQIVQWYRKTMKLTENTISKKMELLESLKLQVSKKEAYNNKMLVYMFVAILRALGLQCRLVLSFQVEPLRPPANELHSVSKNFVKKEMDKQAKIAESRKGNDKTKYSEDNEMKNTSLSEPDMSKTKRSERIKQNEGGILKMEGNDVSLHARKSEIKSSINDGKKDKSSSKDVKKKVSIDTSKISKSKTKQSKSEDNREHNVQRENQKSNKKENPYRTTKRSIQNNVKNEEHVSKHNSKSKKTRKCQSDEDNSNKKFKTDNKKSKGKKLIKTKFPKKAKTKAIPQLDGADSTSSDDTDHDFFILQLDGTDDEKGSTSKRYNLRKLRDTEEECKLKKHSNSLKTMEKEYDSASDFRPRTPFANKNTESPKVPQNCKVMLQKLKSSLEDSEGKPKKKLLKKQLNQNTNEKTEQKHIDIGRIVKRTKPQHEDDGNSDSDFMPEPIKKKRPTRSKTIKKEDKSTDDFKPTSSFANKNTESSKVSQNCRVILQQLESIHKKSRDKSEKISPKKQLNVKNDTVNSVKDRIAEQTHTDRSRTVKKTKLPHDDSDSDSDYMVEPIKRKHRIVKRRVGPPKKNSNKKISSSDIVSGKRDKKGNNVWVEVFLDSEEKWISVDVVKGQVHCVNELFTRATQPVSYILAWNNDNSIKDVTKRYCTNFSTITRKLRIDLKWWDETLKPFLGTYTARDKKEDDDLNRQQLDKPLPKHIAEYKNHPLYVLRRHLLKYEVIYPPDTQPVGFIRGEAVYPRNSVYVCHTRETWLKEAKVVKPGEQPYKIVKARPTYDRLSNKIITDKLADIFGPWQTVDYEPPTAENGIVPRNAFGNVELFKPSMLPKGTVHLKLPGLNKVCRRMNVDCASAFIGFESRGGWGHPMYDGFVVCEEFADSVVAAWVLEQDEIERKENEKIEKRVYGNWKKFIKGLLIRERLKAKYDFGERSRSDEEK